ncbi:MAG TPA: type II toxin-antitoxin system VapC family toxin [Candidatus Omnitrophota bacterium]|nr:type II toxin-antitoxin system VapC family toxin [Candidatus Omnitrophota bacterium]
MEPIKTYFFDTSAIVRLLCNEPGHAKVRQIFQSSGNIFTSWILLAETIGVLKRKWLSKELKDDDYAGKIHYLFALIKEQRFIIKDIECWDGDAALKTYEYDLLKLRQQEECKSLDAADALQLIVIKEILFGVLAGPSKPRLVTGDKGLHDAAVKNNIDVELVCNNEP